MSVRSKCLVGDRKVRWEWPGAAVAVKYTGGMSRPCHRKVRKGFKMQVATLS